MTSGRRSKTQPPLKTVSPSERRKRRRRRRACFNVQPDSAAAPHRQVVAHAKTRHRQTTPPPNPSISSPCQPLWNVTPPSVSYSLRPRCHSPAPERLSLWLSIITQSHQGPAQQPPQKARVAGLQLKHRPQYKPKASHQSRATMLQGHVYAERNIPPTTIVSNTKVGDRKQHLYTV